MIRRRGPFLWLTAAFAANTVAVVAAAFVLSSSYADAAMSRAIAAITLVSVLLAPLLLLAVWKIFDVRVLRNVADLAIEVRAIAHGDRPAVDAGRYAELAPLPDAVNALAGRLLEARAQFADAVEAATAKAEEQAGRIGAILHEVHQGVLVCNLKHQVVLYNQPALTHLHVTGQLGLGRSIFGLVARDPVSQTFEMLLHRREGERSAPFLAGTTDGRSLLQGRMSLITTRGDVTGYVVTFDDVTEQVNALARREALLRELIEGVRTPMVRLRAEMADHEPVARETGLIAAALSRAAQGYRSALRGWWPMSDMHSPDLVDFTVRRLREAGVQVQMVGLPVWLHGDSHTLSLTLDALIRRIQADTGVKSFDLGAGASADTVWLEIVWEGVPALDETIEQWLQAPVSVSLGGMTVRDVLLHHGSDTPLQTTMERHTWLRLPMLPGKDVSRRAPAAATASRPEFFDFDLLDQGREIGAELGAMPLRSLTYVVFDTETTGLQPMEGDQIVSLAGVRIVNGRILTGESFNRIVNPGRPIPAQSVKFHGLTDDMVQDKPPLGVVLPQFKAFCADAVLVGHNVAFDLKFLRMREKESGVAFDNPVLDTMLLSSFLDQGVASQSLDAIAERYGIRIADRHTALGDALMTAAILLKLIDALEARGIRTFDEAVKTLDLVNQLHQREAAFSRPNPEKAGMSF